MNRSSTHFNLTMSGTVPTDEEATLAFLKQVSNNKAHLATDVNFDTKWQKVSDFMESSYKATHFKAAAARKRWETIKDNFLKENRIDPKQVTLHDIEAIENLVLDDDESQGLLRDLVQESLREKLNKEQQKHVANEKKKRFSLLSGQALDKAGNISLKVAAKDPVPPFKIHATQSSLPNSTSSSQVGHIASVPSSQMPLTSSSSLHSSSSQSHPRASLIDLTDDSSFERLVSTLLQPRESNERLENAMARTMELQNTKMEEEIRRMKLENDLKEAKKKKQELKLQGLKRKFQSNDDDEEEEGGKD